MLIAAAAMSAHSAQALSLPDCTRVTHPSHGGEAAHRDFGNGRGLWQSWWSHEGTVTDMTLMDCPTGAALTFRSAEERISDRLPFDRTERAVRAIEINESGSRVFATFERIAADLKNIAVDIQITKLSQEPCACAALYPDARGDRLEFKLGG